MFNLKRNQIIITVLVFMIAVAAYLNTQQPATSQTSTEVTEKDNTQPEEVDFFEGYNEQIASASPSASADQITADENTKEQAAQTDQASKETDNSVVAAADTSDKITATITKKGEDAVDSSNVAASKDLENDYFAEEKLLREQSRAQQIDQLTQYVSNDKLDQDSKAKAAANLIEIQERIEKESSAEALLKAKGFNEVYVRIDDDTVDVVVNKSELTDAEIAQIEEIVNRKTGYSVSKINITPMNGIAKK